MSHDHPSTMCAAFHRTVARRPDEIALRTAGGGPACTWAEYADRVTGIAAGLAAAGVGPGDPIALLLTNRPEFHFVDTAAQHVRAVPFSCYNTSSPAQIDYLLSASGARVAVTEKALAAALAPHVGGALRLLIVVDGDDDQPAGVVGLAGLAAAGDAGFDLAKAAGEVGPDDLLTLVYTSGTTGRPKGVEITHANMVAMAAATAPLLGIRGGDRMISFLPAAHIADRWASHYLNTWAGTELTCLADHRQIGAALAEVRPTLFGAVPQVWQRLVGGIRRLPDPTMRAAVEQSVEIGLRHQRAQLAGEVSAELAMLHRAADQRVLGPLRARLGLDQVRVAVTAAAPTPPEIVEFVNAIGVPLVEGWGMSEVSGLGTLVPPGTVRSATIGLPVPGLEVRLLDDGELLVRGPMVMRGYRDQPAETAAAIDPDGWLHTGDIARRDDDGYLRLVDRKKELLITTGGKNIAPAGVELALRTHCPLIAQAVVIGDARPHLTALLVIDPEVAAATGLPPMGPAELAAHPGVREAVAAGVAAANATLSRAEQVRDYQVLPEVWLPGGDLVTPTMKVRRHAVLRRYAEQVDALYPADRS
jgi:long-chain acyl-CoA synthetase